MFNIFKPPDQNKLKTKRERIIHNEKTKYSSTIFLAIGGGFAFTAALQIRAETAGPLIDAGWSAVIKFLVLIVLGLAMLITGVAHLGALVDPDDLPKPKRRTRRRKKA